MKKYIYRFGLIFFVNIAINKNFFREAKNSPSAISFVNATTQDYKKHNFPYTCLSVPKSICIDNASYMISPPNPIPSLLAYWSFDYLFSVDTSNNGNHFHPGFPVGPPVFGSGSSALIDTSITSSQAIVKLPEALDPSFSLTFWIYIIENPSTEKDKVFLIRDSFFSLGVVPQGGKLRISLDSLHFVSQAAFVPERWTHIAITIPSSGRGDLYWNGLHDISFETKESTFSDTTLFTLGHPPGVSITNEKTSLKLFMDELRVYHGQLKESDIQGHTIAAVSGIPNLQLVQYGCLDCTFEDVSSPTLCNKSHALCSKTEYFDFALSIARKQGFLKANRTKIWDRDSISLLKNKLILDQKIQERRLALCCFQATDCGID
ncbi:uncharacterized protein LOC128883057 isoform X1 [Hylaeus volcanicus]|uniref:uncharacterized protein LOC128883057 isoform X1 n=1 Tax=Hylaeus volcanicus TaxID=313075 RepID=UPI0023B83A88|nr:uncharacterized protein LOC128883057 isoform X1 [Hylaeus volcanicus]